MRWGWEFDVRWEPCGVWALLDEPVTARGDKEMVDRNMVGVLDVAEDV